MKLFGFTIKREVEETRSIIPPTNDDGSIVVNNLGSNAFADSYALAFDPDGLIKTEIDLIRRYRELSRYPEVSEAIEDIVNEAITVDDVEKPVKLNLEDLKLSDGIKKKINDSFDEILQLLDFNEAGYSVFERWYVDGKILYHIILDQNDVKSGIKELRVIDPRKIKKIKKINKTMTPDGIEIVSGVEEFFVYNERGITDTTTSGVRMSPDSVIFVPSGLIDSETGMIQSHLHKAIKPANQLKMLEDSVIIYRYTRAPERRVFYIDVGNLPKGKAEEFVQQTMNKFRNKVVYDAKTGDIADSKRHTSMIEDFWLARRDGGKGTEIQTLPGGQGLGEISDLDYFKDKLYHSLNVPISRMRPDQTFSLGRSNEISRDEIKFSKFIIKLRSKFNTLFYDALRVHLIAKGIVTHKDWENIKHDIKLQYAKDNHFAEMKESEIAISRLQNLAMADPFVGKYYSRDWIKRNILFQDDDEIKQLSAEMDQDLKDFPPPFDPEAEQQQPPPGQ